ncbi:MAG: polyprenyl diphosphate synthase [Burkholderiales bacterium]
MDRAPSAAALGASGNVPRHVAIVMDGNGRWAKQKMLPRAAGHRRGVEAVRRVVKACDETGIRYLTLFAFSSENWRRPSDEVSALMMLIRRSLQQEISRLHQNRVSFKVIGDRTQLESRLATLIRDSETLTELNDGLTLTLAINYGGRWDIVQALQKLMSQPEARVGLDPDDLAPYLSMHYAPDPDLFIRTGGEQRISNFLLWQMAYTEFYFTDTLWPDFTEQDLYAAIHVFQQRERRYGATSEQIEQNA